MPDREKLSELLSVLQSQTADLQAYLTGGVPPVDALPSGPPKASAPAEVLAPAGQNVAWVPVTLDRPAQGVSLRVTRVQNASPATINVGGPDSQSRYLTDEVYRWSATDDLTQYVRLQLPGSAYRDGQQVIYNLTLTGADTKHLVVKVTFRNGVEHPDIPSKP